MPAPNLTSTFDQRFLRIKAPHLPRLQKQTLPVEPDGQRFVT
jgi:hypothetical protein